jgi:outer membrane protein TolC
LFGSIHEALDGLGAKVDLEKFALESARLNLAGNVVNAAAREAGLRSQRAIIVKLVETQQTQIDLVKARMKLGAASRNDLLAAEGAIELTRATLPAVDKALTQNQNLLARLVGRGEQAQSLPVFELSEFKLPETLPLSLPISSRQRHRFALPTLQSVLPMGISIRVSVLQEAMAAVPINYQIYLKANPAYGL